MVILRGEQRQPGRRLPTGAEARTPQLQPPTCRRGTRRSGPAALSTARAPARQQLAWHRHCRTTIPPPPPVPQFLYCFYLSNFFFFIDFIEKHP